MLLLFAIFPPLSLGACIESSKWHSFAVSFSQYQRIDPTLSSEDTHELCRQVYPLIFASFELDISRDRFDLKSDCPGAFVSACIICAQSAALGVTRDRRQAFDWLDTKSVLPLTDARTQALNSVYFFYDLATRALHHSCMDCFNPGGFWGISFDLILQNFALAVEAGEGVAHLWLEEDSGKKIPRDSKEYVLQWFRGRDSEASFWKGKLRPNPSDSDDIDRFNSWMAGNVKWFHDSPCMFLDESMFTSGFVRVLNSGSGPFAPVGLTCQFGNSSIYNASVVSADGLARYYFQLYAETLDHPPPAYPLPCPVEKLTDCFPTEYFHVSHMLNALDHVFDPLLGIKQLLRVTKFGGVVMLRHAENEGANGGFRFGLHQWAFTVKDGRFIIWNNKQTIDVQESIRGLGRVSAQRRVHPSGNPNDGWYIFVDIVRT